MTRNTLPPGGSPRGPFRYDLGELKARADLVAEVEARSGPGRYAGRTVTFSCPHPSHPDRSPSFTVDTSTGRWRCWSQCDRGGDVVDLVEWLDGLPTGEAISHLAERYGVAASTPDAVRSRPRQRPRPPRPVRLVTPAKDTGSPHPDPDKAAALLDRFLADRGWDREVADAVGLSVVLDHRGRERVRFPFRRGGEVLLWQDRALHEGHQPKWLTPSGATLYPFGLELLAPFGGNLDECPDCPLVGCPAVWLVEGPADAVTLRAVWPAVAALGIPGANAWHDHYAAALVGLPVVVVTDNDTAGENLRAKVTSTLENASAVPLNLHVPDPYKDLSEWHLGAGREEFQLDLLDRLELVIDAEVAKVERGVA